MLDLSRTWGNAKHDFSGTGCSTSKYGACGNVKIHGNTIASWPNPWANTPTWSISVNPTALWNKTLMQTGSLLYKITFACFDHFFSFSEWKKFQMRWQHPPDCDCSLLSSLHESWEKINTTKQNREFRQKGCLSNQNNFSYNVLSMLQILYSRQLWNSKKTGERYNIL